MRPYAFCIVYWQLKREVIAYVQWCFEVEESHVWHPLYNKALGASPQLV